MSNANPKTYVLGIIAFTLVILGGMAMLGDLNSGSGGVISSDSRYSEFNNTFNRYDDLDTQVNTIKGNIEDEEGGGGVFGFLDNLVNSAWSSIKLMFSSFNFMNDAFNGLSSMFGVPSWVGGLIILAVIVIIGFSIYAAVFQVNW
jgi:hypothetical protein